MLAVNKCMKGKLKSKLGHLSRSIVIESIVLPGMNLWDKLTLLLQVDSYLAQR